jgi:hypothetical protein
LIKLVYYIDIENYFQNPSTKETIVRKFSAFMIAVIFIMVSVTAYACGDKSSSAKKVDASKAEATTVQASVSTDNAQVQTAQAVKATGSCSAAGSVKATQADVKVQQADMAKTCPASSACPASSNCKAYCPASGKNMSKETKSGTVDATTGGATKETVAMAPKTEKNDK